MQLFVDFATQTCSVYLAYFFRYIIQSQSKKSKYEAIKCRKKGKVFTVGDDTTALVFEIHLIRFLCQIEL